MALVHSKYITTMLAKIKHTSSYIIWVLWWLNDCDAGQYTKGCGLECRFHLSESSRGASTLCVSFPKPSLRLFFNIKDINSNISISHSIASIAFVLARTLPVEKTATNRRLVH